MLILLKYIVTGVVKLNPCLCLYIYTESVLSIELIAGIAGGVGGALFLVIIVLVVVVCVLMCQVRKSGHLEVTVSGKHIELDFVQGSVLNLYNLDTASKLR